MFRLLPSARRLFCAAAILFLSFAFLPVWPVSADELPKFTPKQQAQADRLKKEYQQLRNDMYALNDLFAQAAGYRQTYLRFMYGEQVNKHDTSMLEAALALYDSYITQGLNYQKKGHIDLGYPKGFDSTGQNVININVVSGEINAALPDYLTSRNYARLAIYTLHSALNLYHQRSSLDVPNVPKYHPSPYCLACIALAQ